MSVFIFLMFAIVPLSGCAESIVENATESAIENAMEEEGKDVDVDYSDGNFEINADGVTFQGGEDSQWPVDFPSDVYQIEGKVLSSMSDLTQGSYWVMVQTTLSVDEAVELYTSELKSQGWAITGTSNFSGSQTLAAEKDNRSLAIMVTSTDGQTSVTITESKL